MKDNLNALFNSFAVVGTLIQTEHIFQIISLVLTCVSVLVSLILSLKKWYKQAKSDCHIDSDEIDEALSEIDKATNEIKDTIDKGGNDNEWA